MRGAAGGHHFQPSSDTFCLLRHADIINSMLTCALCGSTAVSRVCESCEDMVFCSACAADYHHDRARRDHVLRDVGVAGSADQPSSGGRPPAVPEKEDPNAVDLFAYLFLGGKLEEQAELPEKEDPNAVDLFAYLFLGGKLAISAEDAAAKRARRRRPKPKPEWKVFAGGASGVDETWRQEEDLRRRLKEARKKPLPKEWKLIARGGPAYQHVLAEAGAGVAQMRAELEAFVRRQQEDKIGLNVCNARVRVALGAESGEPPSKLEMFAQKKQQQGAASKLGAFADVASKLEVFAQAGGQQGEQSLAPG